MEQHQPMKKLLLVLALCLISSGAWAQCTGVFQPNSLCGNIGPLSAPPHQITGITSTFGPAVTTSGDIPNWVGTTGVQLGDQANITTGQNFNFTGVLSGSGANNWSNTTSLFVANITSQFFFHGQLITFPAGAIPCLSCNQTWTGQNIYTAPTSMTTLQVTSAFFYNPISVPNGGTGVTSSLTHAILLGEGTAPTSSTGVGTTGQCLTGTGTDPLFLSGCRVLLATLTAVTSTPTLTDITHFTSYNDYELVFDSVMPVVASQTCEIQYFIGSAYQSTNYVAESIFNGTGTAPTTFTPCSNGTLVGNTAFGGISGTCRIHNAGSTTQSKSTVCLFGYANATQGETGSTFGTYTASLSPVTGFQVLFATGSVATSSVIKLYGLQ